MVCAVERWPDQIVHSRVYNQKALAIIFFFVDHRGEQSAGRADNRPPRLEQEVHFQTTQGTRHSLRVSCKIIGKVCGGFLISDTKAAADVDVVDLVSIGAQVANKISKARNSLREGRDVGDLRSDVGRAHV